MSKRLTIEEVKEKLFNAHGDTVSLVEDSYVTTQHHATFIDKDFGPWEPMVYDVIYNKKCCPQRADQNRKQTCLNKYGVENPMQNEQIKNRLKDSIFKKFGVESVAVLDSVKKKRKQTCLQKYGVECNLQEEDTKEKIKQTCLKKYGVEHPSQNKEISLRAAKTANQITVLKHWFSREGIQCRGTYEVAVIEYFNKNKIDFNFQPQTFLMSDRHTYTPDLYLPDQDLWVEIKGTFRTWDPTDDAEKKWNWFHGEHPNSELWIQDKLKELGLWRRILELQKERKIEKERE